MLTDTVYQNNILDCYSRAGRLEHTAGKRWYAEALQEAKSIAKQTGLPLTTVVGVIAVTSPRQHWVRNVRVARALCLGQGIAGVLRVSKEKALRILAGEHPLDVIGPAPKTRAFYLSILAKGDSASVCVDSWAKRAAVGTLADDGAMSIKEYHHIARAYVTVANSLNIPPAKLQAIVWLTVRQNYQRRLI